jgi:GNAT superfamily N-acetyltransferase
MGRDPTTREELAMMRVRRLDRSDWRVLREGRLAALRDSPAAFWATWEDESRYTSADWVAFMSRTTWFTAVSDGGRTRPLVGLVGCLQREELPDEPEVVGMWVAPGRRGTGTADALIGALHAWALDEGVRSLGLWVVEGNDRARRFYERHLYRCTGERAPLPDRRPGHEQRMRRTTESPSDVG